MPLQGNMTVPAKLRVCMAVACANDVSGASHRDESRQSPLLHTAIHNLLDGLRDCEDLEVEVIYGRMQPKPGEDRWEGCLHYVPIRYKPFPIPGMGGPYLARTLALLRHIKKTKPDLVHGQGTERESGLVAALSKCPSALTLHGNFRQIAKTLKSPLWSYYSIASRLEGFVGRRVNGIICISSYTKDLVRGLNKKLWVLPNAVNSAFFDIENRPRVGKIICIAGITEWKNQVEFLEAFKKAGVEIPNLSVEFWGPINVSHPYAKEFIRLVENLPFATYKGSARPDEIPMILKNADILVLPSIEDNCPVCILEAMAGGIPVVATNVGGIPDLVREGETGFLSGPTNQSELWRNLATLVKNRDLRTSFSIQSRKHALQKYTSQSIASEHVKIYRSIVSGSK